MANVEQTKGGGISSVLRLFYIIRATNPSFSHFYTGRSCYCCCCCLWIFYGFLCLCHQGPITEHRLRRLRCLLKGHDWPCALARWGYYVRVII